MDNIPDRLPLATNITPGIYFGLDEDTYHAAPWIGSSSMKNLYACPPDYWFESHMNPLRPADEPTMAQTFGRALHHRILYGVEAFARDYTFIGGTTGDSVSAEDLKTWIKEQGSVPQKLKADNERMVREMGVNLLTETTYERIMVAAAHITKNPNLANAFTGGFPEVSVFWYEDGVPCKARWDYWKSRAIVDLKSFRSKDRIRSLDETVLQDLFNYRYDIQVAHYLNGHVAAAKLLEEGAVHVAPGWSAPTKEWMLNALVNPAHWAFVFFRADGMPVAKSYQIPNGSPAHASGRYAVNTALAAYKDHLERFGTDAWVNTDEPFTIADEDMPKWL
jgi:hypothetical protein